MQMHERSNMGRDWLEQEQIGWPRERTYSPSRINGTMVTESQAIDIAKTVVKIDKAVRLLALRQEFETLRNSWRKKTCLWSNVNKKVMQADYQRIISLGKDAVPMILEALRSDMDDWFWALTVITNENPIQEEDAGHVEKMAEAWVKWGIAKGLIK